MAEVERRDQTRHSRRPLTLGTKAKIVFGTGLRLTFRVIEFEEGRLFTDESRMPGARMGHRHMIEPGESERSGALGD